MSLILVTGGCGFIGRHVVEALVRGGARVRVLDVGDPAGLPAGVEIHRASILDAARLAEAMRGAAIVHHVAGISHFWTRRRADLAQVNARGTAMVLEAAAAARVRRVVHCSSATVLRTAGIGAGAPLHDLAEVETMPGPYTRSKREAEATALAAAEAGLDVVIASPTVPIGARDANRTPPAAMLAQFLDGGAPAFLDCTLNLVGVRDVAAGMLLAAEHGRRGARYVLDGEDVRLSDLLGRLERLSGRRMPRLALPGAAARAVAALAEWTADHVTGRPPVATREGVRLALGEARVGDSKARDELGYRPAPIDGPLAEAVRWLMAEPSAPCGAPAPRPSAKVA
ncbi:NAD-dependent epimerase/dehydratase family protein [Methylobacterium durans]|uniref:NAD-dependent epimerase/dehydratase family protein n=1 Tax=Methylobacterium durans TaxID=2202825 RepID=UPI002AFE752F|nr:NAD-dependent epimerase/dehydratase family protein [Methylobacterium durans]MEA1833619.1 NAD-dependent epimerase/dehydratase family protein [Methylobacterium durans]